MFTLKGFNHRMGEYQGRNYDNYVLFGINQKGDWEMVKVKASVLADAGIKDLKVFIDNKLELLYDRYGGVQAVRMAK